VDERARLPKGTGLDPAATSMNLNRSNQKTSIPFRPDIEGLRALVVGLVSASHAELPFLQGGFVGVDFFSFFPAI
jgi:peptidoglycan/LPS O-acetylase OafA/YrhL